MELRLAKEAAVRVPQLVVSPRTKAANEKSTHGDNKEKSLKHKTHKRSSDVEEHQQNDDEDDGECVVEDDDDDDEQDSESDDDAKSYTSNQTEDDEESDDDYDADDQQTADEPSESERQENDRDALPPVDLKKTDEKKDAQMPPVIRASVVSGLKSLSVTVAEPMKKVIQEPRPPRGSGTFVNGVNISSTSTSSMSKSESKKARQKFQFPDSELLNLVLEDENMSTQQPSSSRGAGSGASQRRRFSSTAAVMATTLPLRRKSFSLTKGPIKNHAAATSPMGVAPPAMSPSKSSRFQARRKSTSACYSLRNFGAKSPLSASRSTLSSLPSMARSSSASPMATAAAAAAAASVVLPPTSSSATSQMVLRVRERKSDGIPELVISKRPARFLVWNWNDRQIRVPFKIQLGPHQHGIMLRQLRYVKSVMNDFPWAKTHLKELLAAYTTKDMSKEELYPQLNQLSSQVQQEIGTQVKKQKNLLVKKQRLTMQLSLATSVINEMHVTKYGRRGKPHDTKLYYDPGQPTRLHWIRKNGERSAESLDVDIIEVHCYDNDSKESELSAGIKKAVKKFTNTASLESCVSLVTPSRTLDVQLKSAMHREWLVNALCDVISFARQYRAAGARREQQPQPSYTHLLRRM